MTAVLLEFYEILATGFASDLRLTFGNGFRQTALYGRQK